MIHSINPGYRGSSARSLLTMAASAKPCGNTNPPED